MRLRGLTALWFALWLSWPAAAIQNVLLVVADDLGVNLLSDFECASGCPATPNIHALAQAGVKFPNFNAQPLCSPTRAALLTGERGVRTGIGTIVSPSTVARNGLPPQLPNILHDLKAAGYRTFSAGKHHLWNLSPDYPNYQHAYHLGYDFWEGIVGFATNVAHGAGTSGVTGYSAWERCSFSGCFLETQYNTSWLTSTIASQMAGSAPWFGVANYAAPHAPFHCPPDGHSFGPTCGGATDFPTLVKAMIENFDTNVGTLLSGVNYANTCVIFFGDNGPEGVSVVSPLDANKSKGTVYRDGTRVPLIFRGNCVTSTGTSTALAQVTDLAATILDIVGLPENPAFVDSISMKPYLANPALASRRGVSCGELFFPNGYPASPDTSLRYDKFCEDGAYRLQKMISSNVTTYEMYDEVADPHSASPLNLGALTSPQQNAYNVLSPSVEMPETTPSFRMGARKP